MYIEWNLYDSFIVKVDGLVVSNHAEFIPCNEGWHSIEVLGNRISTNDLKKKIIRGWISGLCGAVIFTIDDALKDIYDSCVSFDYYITKKDEIVVIENIERLRIRNFCQKNVINKKRLKCLIITMLLPVIALCFLLSATFISLGVLSVLSNVYVGFVAIFLGILFVIFTLIFISKLLFKIKGGK